MNWINFAEPVEVPRDCNSEGEFEVPFCTRPGGCCDHFNEWSSGELDHLICMKKECPRIVWAFLDSDQLGQVCRG